MPLIVNRIVRQLVQDKNLVYCCRKRFYSEYFSLLTTTEKKSNRGNIFYLMILNNGL